MTYMTQAMLSNDIDKVKLLQKAGLDINAKDENGWTPLMYAVASKDQVFGIRSEFPWIIKRSMAMAEFVQQMIDNGAKVTPEVLALAAENDDIRRVLENASGNDRQGLKDEMKKQARVSAYFGEKKIKDTEIAAAPAPVENSASKANSNQIDVQFLKNRTTRQI